MSADGRFLTFDSDRILIKHGAQYTPPKVNADRAPKAYSQLVRSRPILGAALLTLEAVDAPPSALAAATAALQFQPESQNPFHGVSVHGVPTHRS